MSKQLTLSAIVAVLSMAAFAMVAGGSVIKAGDQTTIAGNSQFGATFITR